MAILDIDEAAEYLKMSRKSLERLVRKGEIPATQLIGKWIFSERQLTDYIEVLSSSNVKAPPPKEAPPKQRRRSNLDFFD
jgi:excisionase family DNA binding protein